MHSIKHQYLGKGSMISNKHSCRHLIIWTKYSYMRVPELNVRHAHNYKCDKNRNFYTVRTSKSPGMSNYLWLKQEEEGKMELLLWARVETRPGESWPADWRQGIWIRNSICLLLTRTQPRWYIFSHKKDWKWVAQGWSVHSTKSSVTPLALLCFATLLPSSRNPPFQNDQATWRRKVRMKTNPFLFKEPPRSPIQHFCSLPYSLDLITWLNI